MTRKQSIFSLLLFFAFVSSGVVLFSQGISERKIFNFLEQWSSALFQQAPIADTGTFFVKRVVDGDTIELESGQKVRYIGVNTPESVDPRRTVECFGKEASAFNKELVEGKTVFLKRDISDTDKYGRLLRFVYLENGTFVNEILVQEGYALVSTYPPDVSKQDIFRTAEQKAREGKKGLWNETTCNGKK